MRVIVEVISGPAASRRVSLVAGQSIRIGRTDWADVSFPRDQLMSGIHFLLETDASGCSITDQGSRNGTFVNGRRIDQKTLLRDGDRIVAGQTRFAVRIEGVSASAAAPSPPGGQVVPQTFPPPGVSSVEGRATPGATQSDVFPADPESSTVRPAPESLSRQTSCPPEPTAIRPAPA
jgi:pSer/pThr/pTyr-binding forkhead associated (FHA) protein